MLSLLLSCMIVVAQPASSSGTQLSAQRRQLAVRVLDMVIETRYAEAFALADSLAQLGDPTFRMLKLMGIGLRDMDFETAVDASDFDSTYHKALHEVEAMSGQKDARAYALTLKGFVQAARSGRDLREGRYLRAVRAGREALELMREATAIDSTLVDPQYFLGLYDFAMADLRKRLWWVLFWLPGDRERGIARLERSRTQSLFAASAATLSLLDAYIHEERFDDAQRILDELLERFPHSRFVWWGEARLAQKLGDNARAADVYGRLADSYASQPHGAYNALVCRVEQARFLAAAGKTASALAMCRRALEACAMNDFQKPCGDARKLFRRLESGDTD